MWVNCLPGLIFTNVLFLVESKDFCIGMNINRESRGLILEAGLAKRSVPSGQTQRLPEGMNEWGRLSRSSHSTQRWRARHNQAGASQRAGGQPWSALPKASHHLDPCVLTHPAQYAAFQFLQQLPLLHQPPLGRSSSYAFMGHFAFPSHHR